MILYHLTRKKHLDSICEYGLLPTEHQEELQGRAMTRIEFETTNSGTGTKVTVRIEDADRERAIACFLNLVIDGLQMCSPRVAVERLAARPTEPSAHVLKRAAASVAARRRV
jgi:hypothetical protein